MEDGEASSATPAASSVVSEARGTLQSTLLSGCRCIGLALAVIGGDLQVLLQDEYMPFSEALHLVDQLGFKGSPFPVILVLHLGLLSVAACTLVPRVLAENLGD